VAFDDREAPRVKLLFFTPAARTSAIASMARIVADELVRSGNEVFVVRTENHPLLSSPAQAFPGEMIRWDDHERVLALSQIVDSVVYQVGDHFEYHRGCLEWLPTLPGVVCLHDFFVGNLFWGWAADHPEASRIVRSLYGERVAASYFAPCGGADELVARSHRLAPMTEWVASMASGVVTHSRWDIDRVLAGCAGPVSVAPLAYPLREHAPSAASSTSSDPRIERTIEILTIGNVNANKRVESVIRAVGSSERLRGSVRFRLVGGVSLSYAESLRSLADAAKVSLSIDGHVDDETLALALHRAEILCCLRNPVLEAASASAIEAMLAGKATIVADAGFFAELPSDVVQKIDLTREVDSLRDALEALAVDSNLRSALGSRARTYARRTFTAERYVPILLDVCEKESRSAEIDRTLRRMRAMLAGWGGLDAPLAPETLDALALFDTSDRASDLTGRPKA